MKYAVEMGSSVMMYIHSFIKIDSGFQKFVRGTHRHTDSTVISKAHFYYFFQNKTFWEEIIAYFPL
jgi:hypothetical protein